MKGVLTTVVLLLVLVCVLEAKRVAFVLNFDGVCTTNATYCSSKASSQRITSLISANNGPQTTFEKAAGSVAIFHQHLRIQLPNTFFDRGNMTFGTHLDKQHSLYFRSFGAGHFTSHSGRYVAGSTVDIVDGGGIFRGAKGLASVISVYHTATGKIENNVWGELEVPDHNQ
eukprot:TRINITY_DN22849_c0_g1_i1.p1 TRINITY_DN22849_c0_g1~~TRINITY_DN22849_c0_g1_i1.p1  ORF type:complete len:171 (+),score=37.55 TRINITY_DN22849_c0_g1_i1:16-528(+)